LITNGFLPVVSSLLALIVTIEGVVGDLGVTEERIEDEDGIARGGPKSGKI
jgi:hypothetical protein